jgi:hypothetical protein
MKTTNACPPGRSPSGKMIALGTVSCRPAPSRSSRLLSDAEHIEMKYYDGRAIRVGDKVRLGHDEGVVVFSIDSSEYAADFPKAEWEYLEHGIMIHFSMLGLVHIEQCDPDLSLLGRALTNVSG